MRLTNIKMSGFKSFVGPVDVPLKGELMAIVGPNGCGKSNVIDAVRLVLGERSAKFLRGESITDMIFNGSTERKPVGQASVELVFDNSDASLGGEYAQYNEISVRRQVKRDGQSNYYLNGTRCRRKDITDIFLGTGLGPRSYAIIEQGMISHFIEAKPDDLRIFIEEAAGISKYKERRKETENRIRHTRDNLDRLTDLREELGKQLERLNRQSKAAAKYKIYKEEEKVLKAQLLAIRWQLLTEQMKTQHTRVKEQEIALEAKIAEQHKLSYQIEELREKHREKNESFNEVQGRFYSIGADIARLEENLQHQHKRREQLQQECQQAEEAWKEAKRSTESDERLLESLKTELAEIEPESETVKLAAEESAQAQAEAESAMSNWQSQWDKFNQEAAKAKQESQVALTRMQHIEQQLTQIASQIERVETELQGFNQEALSQEIAALQAQQQELEQATQQQQQQLESLQQQRQQQRQTIQTLNQQLNEARENLQALRGQRASLEALQKAALGRDEQAVMQWLSQHSMQDSTRLAETISVDEGWECAVETVLGAHLQSVCTDNFNEVATTVADLQKGQVSLFDTQIGAAQDVQPGMTNSLLDKVSGGNAVATLLQGIKVCEDLTEALALRTNLAANESIVTRDGIWVGPNWLWVGKDTDDKAGVLQREKQLQNLIEQIDTKQSQVANLQQQVEAAQQGLAELEQQLQSQQSALSDSRSAQSQCQAQLRIKQDQLERQNKRQQQLQQDQRDLLQRRDTQEQQLRDAQQAHEAATARMNEDSEKRENLQRMRDSAQQTVTQARQTASQHRERAHQLAMRVQSAQSRMQSTEQALERLRVQLERSNTQHHDIRARLAETSEPIEALEKELADLLEKQVSVEVSLKQERTEVESVQEQLQQSEQQRDEVAEGIVDLRGKLEQIRLSGQESEIRAKTFKEQIEELSFELDAVLKDLPDEYSEERWEQELERMATRISRLGPINLAAIDEYEQESERKVYLDAQDEDLCKALATLEDAIRKIDKETKQRFKDTFDIVNGHFQHLFPKLFGGGRATLELTGDDLLETGISVIAQPPGKRNSTIHALSGGEKALTAISLVFSIFQLNPAPFCMLDEVDAPLDDANVGRFCNLVKEMAKTVQVVFISHNKVAIEMAESLIGVTMAEPGVSRLVAVDVEQAAGMVEEEQSKQLETAEA